MACKYNKKSHYHIKKKSTQLYIKYSDISAPGYGQGLQKTAKFLLAYPEIPFLLHTEIKYPKSCFLTSFLFPCH